MPDCMLYWCHSLPLRLQQAIMYRLQRVSVAGVQTLWRCAGECAVCRHQHRQLHVAVFERGQNAYSQMLKGHSTEFGYHRTL